MRPAKNYLYGSPATACYFNNCHTGTTRRLSTQSVHRRERSAKAIVGVWVLWVPYEVRIETDRTSTRSPYLVAYGPVKYVFTSESVVGRRYPSAYSNEPSYYMTAPFKRCPAFNTAMVSQLASSLIGSVAQGASFNHQNYRHQGDPTNDHMSNWERVCVGRTSL